MGKMDRKIIPTHETVKISGRHIHTDRALYLSFSGAFIEFEYTGDRLYATLLTDASDDPRLSAYIRVFVNGSRYYDLPLHEPEEKYLLYRRTIEPETVTIRIVRLSETNCGKVGISGLFADGTIEKTSDKPLKLEFIGDSITCGYGVGGTVMKDAFTTSTEDPTRAYAWKTAEALNADAWLISWSGNGLITHYVAPDVDVPRNKEPLMYDVYRLNDLAGSRFAGVPEDTEFDFSTYTPDAVIINLGTNDQSYTRGIKERVDSFKNAYTKLLKFVCEKRPEAHVFCTLGIMGQDLCNALGEVVSEVGKELKKEDLIHFLMFDLQNDEDGLAVDWHPSERTHEKASKVLVKAIRKELRI